MKRSKQALGFKRDRSARYEDAVTALEALVEAEDSNSAERALAEVVAPIRAEIWSGQTDGKTIKSQGAWWGDLYDMNRTAGAEMTDQVQMPGDDHTFTVTQDGQAKFFVSEPYQLHLIQLREIVALCDLRGLDVTIDARRAKHFPGHTLAVIYQRAEDETRQVG